MTSMRISLATLAIFTGLWTGIASAQDSAPAAPRVSFRFERAGLAVPRYTLTVFESGEAIYEGEQVPPASSHTVSDAAYIAAATPFKASVRISPATTKRVFSDANSLKDFNVQCESHLRNVADTGRKTLSFAGPEGHGECTYNFSENKAVVELTDTFLGMAETMDQGRQLEHLHRFDRLGLDAAISSLAQEVSSGRALELGTIAGTLRSIASDGELMQRVRLRASQLLSLLPAEMQGGSQ